ncbi:hypothetical protein CGW93_04555 [candidate division bacterium WOR-3 4484_18]|uniref:Calcineurin-like phosphoesterase domain-containing protein n=1 Tax=candidate division WOR-3 bacterium 4484_18 TaxID=2020626 RepID=A0A257LT75_UNCW3|nr:MAG: hypothetical protein CGW93_04555 [candidate division bacterium WOR-3 4484_18]
MKLAILSDIHGNWEAFSAVLEFLDKEKVDKIIILGDIVGYGADPNLCVKKAKEVAEVNLIGNHDAAVVGLTSLEEFNPFAKEACIWTSKVLDSESGNIYWMCGMRIGSLGRSANRYASLGIHIKR